MLLLHEDLRDQDIPQRMKLQSLVIAAWQDHFATFKSEMDVS
jgi:hypothetical protein